MSASAPPTLRAASPRHPQLDALRALALLPVVVVNFSGYATLPLNGPLAAPAPSDGALAWVVTVLLLALVQGKGLALLMFLFGYSLVLGGALRQRLQRLRNLGLAHGLLLYCGDVAASYAMAGLWVRRWLALPARRLWRRAWRLLLAGALLQLAVDAALSAAGERGPSDIDTALADLPHIGAWSLANAGWYLVTLLTVLLVYAPWLLGVVALGAAAARQRWLSHRRWRAQWRSRARWAGPMLALQLAWAAAMAGQLVGEGHPQSMAHTVQALLGLLAWWAWLPWLLLRRRWPAWLVRAGRQTLSLYLLCSAVTVLGWCAWGLGWRPGVLPATLGGLGLWAALMALAAWAGARGLRLPAEAWMARGRA
ncbi:MAG: DUF418 domain-containing protein [Burkholderiaceae bacterium]|nr:DUF418 domain-containing protein [Burkholderiaceae bacterium]